MTARRIKPAPPMPSGSIVQHTTCLGCGSSATQYRTMITVLARYQHAGWLCAECGRKWHGGGKKRYAKVHRGIMSRVKAMEGGQ